MRIISGNFKGKKILFPSGIQTRPLKDMVKESIFNLILHSRKINVKIINSYILDLFSGSGSFGLECVSRGAKKVIFVENYNETLKILKKNINSLKTKNICEIIEENCFEILNENFKLKAKFDLIFIDPPFKEKKINNLLEKIKSQKILKDNGVLIVHRHKKDNIKISEKLKILDVRDYGISKIFIGKFH
tara:strand:- start:595 stop:1161 length:567 start_codon:yes stop_codon:yes gene_type:complete